MPTTANSSGKLPRRFENLVGLMPPRAISDEVQYENTIQMIDRLMAAGRLTRGQEAYLETLVQLVQAYESRHHAIDTTDVDGPAVLRQLLTEHGMNASDLARLLGIHVSMGSKILNGDRALTVEHLRKLAAHFRVRPELFMA